MSRLEYLRVIVDRGKLGGIHCPLDLWIHAYVPICRVRAWFRHLFDVGKEVFDGMRHIREGLGFVHLVMWTGLQMQRCQRIASSSCRGNIAYEQRGIGL